MFIILENNLNSLSASAAHSLLRIIICWPGEQTPGACGQDGAYPKWLTCQGACCVHCWWTSLHRGWGPCWCKAFCRQGFGMNLEEVALGVLQVELVKSPYKQHWYCDWSLYYQLLMAPLPSLSGFRALGTGGLQWKAVMSMSSIGSGRMDPFCGLHHYLALKLCPDPLDDNMDLCIMLRILTLSVARNVVWCPNA